MHDLTLATPLFGPDNSGDNVSATADTAVPGAIWQSTGPDAGSCADDTANGNAGSVLQVFQCNSDLSQYWVQTGLGQLVHNGDCLDLSDAGVVLNACDGVSASQQWTVDGSAGSFGEIVNTSTSQCLTLPSAADGTAFTMTDCTPGQADQQFTAPAAS